MRYPIQYIDGNMIEFGGLFHLSRMMRYTTEHPTVVAGPILKSFDENGIGAFTDSKDFRLFLPYTRGMDYIIPKSDAPTYMKEGNHGVFFGPLFLDGAGHTMMIKDRYYMIVPEP